MGPQKTYGPNIRTCLKNKQTNKPQRRTKAEKHLFKGQQISPAQPNLSVSPVASQSRAGWARSLLSRERMEFQPAWDLWKTQMAAGGVEMKGTGTAMFTSPLRDPPRADCHLQTTAAQQQNRGQCWRRDCRHTQTPQGHGPGLLATWLSLSWAREQRQGQELAEQSRVLPWESPGREWSSSGGAALPREGHGALERS